MSEKPIVLVENCQLEFQRHRGVLYVHGPEGATILRVCQIPFDENVLDKDGRATRLVDVADRRGDRFLGRVKEDLSEIERLEME